MKVRITAAPEGAKFDNRVEYTVHGANPKTFFVFDDDCEPYFLSDELEYEEVERKLVDTEKLRPIIQHKPTKEIDRDGL